MPVREQNLPGSLDAAQWRRIARLLPVAGRSSGRRRTTDLRAVVTAINFHWRTGRPWRKLPPNFPPWPTVYFYYRTWRLDGTLRKLRQILKPPKRSEVDDANSFRTSLTKAGGED